MPGSIQFHKYTALGNNFILIDELDSIVLEEHDKFRFAQEYADFYFGIGGDGILFVQQPSHQTFNGIRQTHGHKWETPDVFRRMKAALCSNAFQADAIMRLIEPNGQESSMCGNGIRCVADYLYRKLGKEKLTIVAEVTTLSPRTKAVFKGTLPNTYQVCMGSNTRLPTQFKTPLYDQVIRVFSDTVEFAELSVPIPLSRGKGFLDLRGYLTYTGEPHLVFFSTSTPFLQEKMSLCQTELDAFLDEEQAGLTHILSLLGDILNDRNPGQNDLVGLFHPNEGINVNIAAIEPDRTEIHMRTYERGIWDATKACGTGATAVVAIAHELGLIESKRIRVLTEGSLFRPPGSTLAPSYTRKVGELVVEKQGEDWWLQGPSEYVYTGTLNDWKKRISAGDESRRITQAAYPLPDLVKSEPKLPQQAAY